MKKIILILLTIIVTGFNAQTQVDDEGGLLDIWKEKHAKKHPSKIKKQKEKQKYQGCSVSWNSNFPAAKIGTIILINYSKISFFVDIKSNCKQGHGIEGLSTWPGVDKDGWAWQEPNQEVLSSYHPYGTSPNSSTSRIRATTISTATKTHLRIFDIGISKTILGNYWNNVKFYIGCGSSRTKIEHITQTLTQEYSYTYLAAIHESYTSTGYDKWSYKIETEYIRNFNITGGLLFNFGIVSLGIGFDTKPKSLNLSFGFVFDKRFKFDKNYY